jgi:hypothetical protein
MRSSAKSSEDPKFFIKNRVYSLSSSDSYKKQQFLASESINSLQLLSNSNTHNHCFQVIVSDII